MINNFSIVRFKTILLVTTFCSCVNNSFAVSYYVSTSGFDTNNGSKDNPFKTIQKAADIMVAGDTCFIHAGIYREWVKPPRGGNSESSRIVYKAFPGEIPVIKGSELITNWIKQSGNVYKADIPNSLFEIYNPFTIKLTDPEDGCLFYGLDNVLGDVYVNGVSYREMMNEGEMSGKAKTWYVQVGTSTTSIWINYSGTSTPNQDQTEVHVRECVFRPSVTGCNYITIDGLTISHGASQWATCCSLQTGMVDVWGGRSWIIQNCHFTDARCAALCSGNTGSGRSPGYHIVRNNTIERCGQAGLIGQQGWHYSLIEGNLIQDINYEQEFGGFETAGMKTHEPVDLTIRNNIFRRIFGGPLDDTNGDGTGNNGIWIDWTGQGIRISGNVFTDIDVAGHRQYNAAIKVEVSHGPILIDNNVFANCYSVQSSSDNLVIVHNLFEELGFDYASSYGRSTPYYKPHTTTHVGSQLPRWLDYAWYNNIFLDTMSILNYVKTPKVDGNAYYEGADKLNAEEVNSIVNTTCKTNFSILNLEDGVSISMQANSDLFIIQTPLITKDFIGIMQPNNQGIENADGTHVTVDRDIFRNLRSIMHPIAGPFENIKPGNNTFVIKAGCPDLFY